MKPNKYKMDQIKKWCLLYQNGMTLAEISIKTEIPKSSIRSNIKKYIKLRPPQQVGRTAWNKGIKASRPVWNKGLKGNYPYPSPNKGKKSQFKNIPRSQEVKDAISLSLRKLD